MQTRHNHTKSGFTLVELLVVIAIIAILTAIIMTNLVSSKAKSRDAKRASDLSQISLALVEFFDRCDQYPTPDTGNVIDATTLLQSTGCPSGITLATYISSMPKDPSTGNPYGYTVNVTNGGTPTDYVLHTTFESSNSVLSQSAPLPLSPPWPTGTVPSSYACQTGQNYCVRPY